MPYSRRRRLRSTYRSSRYYRRYRRYRRYPRMLRYVKYSNGRESSSVNLKVVTNAYYTGQIPPSQNDSVVFTLPSLHRTVGGVGRAYVGPISALESNLYRAYCSLYDEVKLRGVMYEICVTNPIGSAAADLPSFMIFASVDRRYYASNVPPTATQLANYASISPSSYVAYNRTKFKKYIGARDLIEKSQYIDTAISHSAAAGWSHAAVTAAAQNVNCFIPAMFFFVRIPFAPTAVINVQLSIRATYYLTFRNPSPFDAIPAAAAAASVVDEPVEAIEPPVSTSEFIDGDPHLLAGHTSPPLVPI